VQSPFAPATVLSAVPEPLASYLSERAESFRGVAVTAVPARGYPQGKLGGTFLGLLGEAGPAETVGRSGVEAAYDWVLNGGVTTGRVPVDALGREVGPLRSGKRSRPTGTVQLTISTRLQRAAQQALAYGIHEAHVAGYQDAHAGAAVVMNPRTGAVEALASAPELDQAAAATDPAYLRRVLAEPGGPLLDRATEGLYPLGSTFKPVVAEAALAAGLITPSSTLPCVGSLTVGGIVFHNVESWVDARLTLPQALQISCDTWFYRLGEEFFGRSGIQDWARRFGFGRPTGLDVPGESAGIVPTPAWLERTLRQHWFEGDSVNLSIGQGFLEATPLQLAVAYSALANGGTVVRPHVGEAVTRDGRRSVLSFPPIRTLHLRGLGAIDRGLYLAANAPGGTSAAVFAGSQVVVAGKTGTAQTSTGSDDSWYASWAPAGDPKVVVVVLIEHGGFGADAAAPAARRIYDAIFRRPGRAAGPRTLASARRVRPRPGSAAARG
jgi:penicillin-binding protein 2